MKPKVIRWIFVILVLIAIAAAGIFVAGQLLKPSPADVKPAGTGSRKVRFYKSAMMLGEISQTPRKDSMGDAMVPVYEGEQDTTAIKIDPVTTQNMGLRTAKIMKGPVHRVIRTVGTIDFDETAVSEVTTRVPGWIEKLYVDSTGKLVHKGDPLFDFYSPELFLTEREYLLALQDGEAAAATVLNKLHHIGLQDNQIQNLVRTKQVPQALIIESPRDGVVIEKNALQGTMTEPGKMLYLIGDLGTVWALAEIYEQDLPYLQVGQEADVKLPYMPDRQFRGKITYIYPTVDAKTRTAKMRVELPNPGFFLKPGMFAAVEIHAVLVSEAVLVPEMAVLRSGEQNTVFVALDGGKFEPRLVTLGARSMEDTYQVLSGLKEGETVVTSGQFLLDSESQLREAIQKMLAPAPSTPASATNDPPQGAMPGMQMDAVPKPVSWQTAYACPMPEPMSILYNGPGKCPICGMKLVETTFTPRPKPAFHRSAARRSCSRRSLNFPLRIGS